MKNIFRFLSKHIWAVLLILALLAAQAYFDLALPTYTSDLLNVGLQQGGIEDAVPNTIRASQLSDLELFLSDTDAETVEAAYGAADANGVRTLSETADRQALSELLAIPESMALQTQAAEDSGMDLAQIRAAIDAGMMTKEQFLSRTEAPVTQLKKLSDTYVQQIAVRYVAGEYEAQDLDLNGIRNDYLLSVGIRMLLVSLLMMATSILVGLIASRVSAGIGRDLREQLYQRTLSFSSAEMERFSTASLITRATNDVQQIQNVSVLLLRMVLYAPILAIGGIIYVVKTGSGMGWIIILAVILLSALVGVLMAVAMPKFKQMQKLIDRLNLVAREILSGVMPIRAFHREQHEEARFDAANKDLYNTQLFTNRAMTFMGPIMMLIMNGLSVLIVWVGGHRVDAGVIQVGDLTAFITYSMVIVMGFLMLSMVSIILPRAGVAADRIQEVLDTESSLRNPETPRDQMVAEPRGIVCFSDVTFSYPNAEDPAISHVSFVAKPGETTAIIGSTGCGKSTLVKLIPRFYDVSSGSVSIDGADVRTLTQKRLHEMIGYVPQKGMLFSGTVESNLKFAGPQVSDEDMERAAEIAQADAFIRERENGYQAEIAQSGTNVSGGQRQRLSIARAIAKKPKIYLFDDSFSALDYRTDLALRKALTEQMNDATVIIVAQRISTVLHADQILVMEDGRIVGRGTHETLLQSCRTYREIAESQLSEEELSGARKGGDV